EAMACGTPVVTGHVAALAEVGGSAVEQVAHLDAASLGDAMVRLAEDRQRRDNLSFLRLERAHMFSWARAARETLKVYGHAVSGEVGSAAGVPAAYRSSAS